MSSKSDELPVVREYLSGDTPYHLVRGATNVHNIDAALRTARVVEMARPRRCNQCDALTSISVMKPGSHAVWCLHCWDGA